MRVKPRKRLYTPVGRSCPFPSDIVSSARETVWKCRGRASTFKDGWHDKSPNRRISSKSWVGATWFFPKSKVDIAQAELDTMKANASEQLRRSPGAAAVASILQDIETMHPTCKAMIAEASEAAKQVPQGLPYRNHLLRQVGSETMFEFCCDENSTLGQVNEEFGINHFRLTEKNSNVEDH